MKNKLLTKKVLCSVLAASVFGTCGVVFAAETTDNDLVITEQIRVNNSTGDKSFTDKDSLTVIDVTDVMHQGALQAENDKTITISNVGIVNIGTAENRLEGAAIHAQSGYIDIKANDDVNIYAGNNGVLGQYASDRNAVNIEAGGNITIDSEAYAVLAATMTNGEGTATVNISAGDKVIINSKEYAVSVYDQDKNTPDWTGENAAKAIISGVNGVEINSNTSAIYMNRANSANDGILNITSESGDVVIKSVQDAIIMKKADGLDGSLLDADITGANVSITSENGLAVKALNGTLSVEADNTIDYNGGVWVQGETVLDAKAETVNFIGGDKDGIVAIRKDEVDGNIGGHVEVDAKTINISTENEDSGAVGVQSGTQIESAPEGASSVSLTADNINVNAPKLGLVAFSNGQLNVNGNLTVNAEHVIDVRGNSTVNINQDGQHSTVLNGDIVFETPNTPEDSQNSGNIINANVNVNLSGEDSSWTGRAYQFYNVDSDGNGDENVELVSEPYYGNVTGFEMNINNGAQWNMTGDSFINDLTLAENGAVNMSEDANEFNASAIEMNNGVLNLNGDGQEVNVTNLTGSDGTVAVNSLNSTINVANNANTGLTVSGSSNVTNSFDENNISGSMQKLADVMNIEGGNKQITVTSAEGDILGATTALTNENGEIIGSSVKQAENVKNAGITELANVAFMAWRAENDEMHQRMGELRSSTGEAGIWARMKRGESESGDLGITNQYNTYQLGYDEKVGDSNWYIGGAISRTEGKSSFSNGSGENQSTGFTVYGTYVGDDGQYVDLSAKYARLDNEFDVFDRAGMEVDGDYRNNGYAFSAEYGKRIETGNDFWVEPQVQLTYGHLSSANYTTSNDVKAAQDAMNSVVGRVGFAAGKDISAGNVYVKASYLYDFDGDTSVTMSKNGQTSVYDQDLGGGWFEFGVGTNINLSETSHLYFDVERAVGGDIDTPWQWNAGVRFDF